VVLPEFRRRGIGSMLLQDAMQELISLQPVTDIIILEVRESNTAAIKLYEKFSFNIIGKRIGYYQKPSEDAVIMELRMGEKL
jgi:ribosomal-protein-alanine N-acetyltransferase